jgi:hypothetical protein
MALCEESYNNSNYHYNVMVDRHKYYQPHFFTRNIMKKLIILALFFVIVFLVGCKTTQVKKDWVCITSHTMSEVNTPESKERMEQYQEQCMPKTTWKMLQQERLKHGGSNL